MPVMPVMSAGAFFMSVARGMIVPVVILIPVLVGIVFLEGGDARAAVHHNKARFGIGQGLEHKIVQTETVEQQHVGLGQLLHVLGCQGVVVRATCLGRDKQINLRAGIGLNHITRQKVYGICRCKNTQFALACRCRSRCSVTRGF